MAERFLQHVLALPVALISRVMQQTMNYHCHGWSVVGCVQGSIVHVPVREGLCTSMHAARHHLEKVDLG